MGAEMQQFCARLHRFLSERESELLEAMQLETGFIRVDCVEMLEGSLLYVRDFVAELQPIPAAPPLFYQIGKQQRCIQLQRYPWGTVAVILPQNAFLIIALTCLLNALATGNRVLLRAPAIGALGVVAGSNPPRGAPAAPRR